MGLQSFLHAGWVTLLIAKHYSSAFIASYRESLTYLPHLHALLTRFWRVRCINLKAHGGIEIQLIQQISVISVISSGYA
jgi:hypothetical protein